MRAVLILFISTLSFQAAAQLTKGFEKEEAIDMIAICNSFPFIDLYNSDDEILPENYKKRYTSGVFGMDNKYQLYENENIAIINLRGSTDKKISWLENIYSAMIPAKGKMQISGEEVVYCFAQDTSAAVHAGYALGIAYLAKDLLFHINVLNSEGIYDFIITGHSQGGALANMLRAYLENLPPEKLATKNKFKTYAFAAPMVGNREFAEEYNSLYVQDLSSFNIVNPADPIPTFPLSYKETNFLQDNLQAMLFDKGSFDWKKMLSNGAALLFEDGLINTVQSLSLSASKQIAKEVGPVVMPDYVRDINYFKLGNRIEIPPVEYPRFLKDSTILRNDSLMNVYKRGDDGYFLNEELYASQSWTYQHKPYNYYVSLLQLYDPRQYHLLEKKYLRENL